MTKNYTYLGYRYFYSRQYHKWIVEGSDQYYYCDNKDDVFALITLLNDEDEAIECFFED